MRLNEYFEDQDMNHNAWGKYPILFNPGGFKRRMYGYMEIKREMFTMKRPIEGSRVYPKVALEVPMMLEMRDYYMKLIYLDGLNKQTERRLSLHPWNALLLQYHYQQHI